MTQLLSTVELSTSAFMGLMWTFTWTTFFLLLFHFLHRRRTSLRLDTDELLLILSWITLVIATGIWQKVKDGLFLASNLTGGLLPLLLPPADKEKTIEAYLHATLPILLCFYTGIWTAKLSILMFLRQFGGNSRALAFLWRGLILFTAVSYLVALGTIKYTCMTSSLAWISDHCGTRLSIEFERSTLIANAISNIIADALLVAIPIKLLWTVDLPKWKKMTLAAICCVAVIKIGICIVRVLIVAGASDQPHQAWPFLWSMIEHSAAIIIACLSTIDSLFSEVDESAWIPLLGDCSMLAGGNASRESSLELTSMNPNEEFSVFNIPPGMIHVQQEVYVVSEPAW